MIWIGDRQYYQPNLHHNKHTFVITSIVGVVALVGIPFRIYLAHNVFVNSLAMVGTPSTLMHKNMFEYLMSYIDILKLGVIICYRTTCEDYLNLFFQSWFFFWVTFTTWLLMPQLWQDLFFFNFLILIFFHLKPILNLVQTPLRRS